MELELNSLLELAVVKACLEQYIECADNGIKELEDDEKEFVQCAKNIWVKIMAMYDDLEDED